MKKQTGKSIMIGIIGCLLLSSAGCSRGNEENKGQGDTQDKIQTEDTSEQKETKPDRQMQLKRTSQPHFILNGIRSVSLKKNGEEFLHISREPAEYKMSFDYWEILNPYDENTTMNTEVMFKMFEELCSLSFETPAQIEEGIDTGIENSDMGFSVEYVDTMDDSAARNTDEADTETQVILGKEDGNGGRYAAVAGYEEQVYILPEDVLQIVYGWEPFDYILKIPVLISADTLKSVEILTGDDQYEIQVDTEAASYKFGGKDVEKKEFAALYQAISGVPLASEIDGERSEKKDKPALTVIFRRNMAEAPDVQVSYYPYNDEFDSVEVNGKEWFLVRRADVEMLTEQIERAY